MLGFAARARRTLVGVPLIAAALQKNAAGKTPLVVLLANDASENTRKRVINKCAFYRVPLCEMPVDGALLAHTVGKREGLVAAVGVTDAGLAGAILEAFDAAVPKS